MQPVSRRHALASLGAGGVGLLAGCLNAFGGVQSDDHHVSGTVDISGTWPSPDFDTANTRHVPGATGPDSDPTEAWRYCMPENRSVSGAPAVQGGTVYAREGATLRARNASDGAVEWELGRVTSEPYRSPTVTEDTVYLADNADPPEVLAVSRADGSVEWSRELGKEAQSSLVLVHDGTVYALSSGPDTGLLQAFSTTDGTERFRIEREFSTVLAAVDETLVTGLQTGSIVALSATDGTERWRVETGGNQLSTPVIANGTVYVGRFSDSISGGDADLKALRLSDGTLRWRTALETGSEIRGLAVGNGTLYGVQHLKLEGDEQRLIAYDVDDGTQRWQFEGSGVYPPTVTDESVYVTESILGVSNAKGYLYALAPGDGSVRWRHETGENNSGPVIVDDVAVLVTEPRNYTEKFNCLRVLV